MSKVEAGHTFLARLGKTKLRPGGIEATEWLIEQAHIDADTKVLEVACNMGTTMISLAKRYGCTVVGVDQDRSALEKADANIAANGLQDKITTVRANAAKLPFDDASFDVVINEAMLTMLAPQMKQKALAEYARVLKPGGLLLTHDVALNISEDADRTPILEGMRRAINVPAQPLREPEWASLIESAGFTPKVKAGGMTLMSPRGMIKDEGVKGTVRIVRNGLKRENRAMFKGMFTFFRSNASQLGYVAFASTRA